ncbi:SH3 domain-containing protein [Limnobacter parvus]|uniref:SH3 domain-containing protein n=1 Tax=Limnobacter parvus TaxID=2939690 RepID=A0ABT1XH08_9BURK|nr:SH3 domain-containing protein [Limnobacter parvus]MCR2746565.1 SH3 domain-containing protein [Limnobacter parvus]
MRLKPLAAWLIFAGLLPWPVHAQIRTDIRPSIVAQVAETVEKVSRKVAGIPEVMDLENAERPLVLLQVFENRRVVYAKPDANSRAIGEFFKGQLVDAFEEKNGWYRIRIQDSLLGSTDGWIEQGTGQFGELALGVFAPRAFSADVLQDQAGTGIRPSQNATPGIVPTTPLVQRAIPGRDTIIAPRDVAIPVIDPSQVPPPLPNLPRETVAVPDRWRIMQSLGFKFPLYDPYNQNVIKGDLPVLQDTLGPDWFFNLGVIADTLFEQRNFPVPVPPATSTSSGQTNIFGNGDQTIFAHNLIVSLSLTKGNTTFKPPDYEFRLTPVFNYTDVRVNEDRLLKIGASSGDTRREGFVGIQEAFVDVHLRNVSDRYDFDSLRVGIQPFISDFRGFLFQDLPMGIRLFGNRNNNIYQYNIGYFKRVEKDTNSGLNDIRQDLRDDDFFVANLYRQDFPFLGFTSQVSYIHNRNNEDGERYFDANGFLARPASFGDQQPFGYHVDYFGLSGDGHYGRLNITTSTYYASGKTDRHPLAQREQKIDAFFHATEISRDFDWFRLRGNFLYASGDEDPFDDKAEGFDAIFENPQFAGADTSFFIRQNIPLVGGGGVFLSGRNGILPSLRSSKEQGQSNFINPGLLLLGVGADIDVLPELRVVANVSKLEFDNTNVLGVLRQQRPPSTDLGIDASVGFQYRPFFSQNVVINGSFAKLLPGKGYKELFPDDKDPYSFLFNVILSF